MEFGTRGYSPASIRFGWGSPGVGYLANGLATGKEHRVDVAGSVSNVAGQDQTGSPVNSNFDRDAPGGRESAHLVERLLDDFFGEFRLHAAVPEPTLPAKGESCNY